MLGVRESNLENIARRLTPLPRLCNNNYIMPKSKSKTPISGALQKAIVDSELPFLTLEQKTGVKRQSLMKFMAGETSLRLDIADKLADYFGLELTKGKRR